MKYFNTNFSPIPLPLLSAPPRFPQRSSALKKYYSDTGTSYITTYSQEQSRKLQYTVVRDTINIIATFRITQGVTHPTNTALLRASLSAPLR